MAMLLIDDQDVLAAARAKGLRTLGDVDHAFVERSGKIGVLPKKPSEE